MKNKLTQEQLTRLEDRILDFTMMGTDLEADVKLGPVSLDAANQERINANLDMPTRKSRIADKDDIRLEPPSFQPDVEVPRLDKIYGTTSDTLRKFTESPFYQGLLETARLRDEKLQAKRDDKLDAMSGFTIECLLKKPDYKVKVYVNHGYFEYPVKEMASALEHASLIMERGVYRRSNANHEVEFHKVIKVKVCGHGLQSEYPDKFRRT